MTLDDLVKFIHINRLDLGSTDTLICEDVVDGTLYTGLAMSKEIDPQSGNDKIIFHILNPSDWQAMNAKQQQEIVDRFATDGADALQQNKTN